MVSLDGGGAVLPAFTIEGRSTDMRLMGPLAVGGGVGISDPLQSVALQGGGIASLENTVGVEQRAIWWGLHWGRDGRTAWRSIGNSSNLLYRVGGLPTTQPLYEALLHIGCNAADGWPDHGAVAGETPAEAEHRLVTFIWDEFKDRVVTRTAGQQLGYYRNGPCDIANEVADANELIRQTNGQCHSWADLFARTLMAQGVQSGTSRVQFVRVEPIRTLVPDCVTGNEEFMGFLVKHYHLAGGGASGCANHPFRINAPCAVAGSAWFWPTTDAADQNGTPGQGSTDPASFFERHFIVKHGDRYFDPSYGAGPFIAGNPDQAALAWENTSIAGYYGLGVGTFQGQNVARFVARGGTAAREVEFTPFDP